MAIIDHGKIIAQGNKDELKKIVGNLDVIEISLDKIADETIDSINSIELVDRVNRSDGKIEVLSEEGDEVLAQVITVLNNFGTHIASIEVKEPNLESVFLHLTGKSLRD